MVFNRHCVSYNNYGCFLLCKYVMGFVCFEYVACCVTTEAYNVLYVFCFVCFVFFKVLHVLFFGIGMCFVLCFVYFVSFIALIPLVCVLYGIC